MGNDSIVLDNDILEFNDFRIYGVEGTMALLNGSKDGISGWPALNDFFRRST